MPPAELSALVERAKSVLAGNWVGRYTKPAPHLYPHQWNWDSGFIAVGYARYDQLRAESELDSLFEAQWANGMLPQIVFNRDALGGYFPEPEFWRAELSPHYPKGSLTSGITMPPVHATAALRVLRFAKDFEQARCWARRLYPKLLALHEYLYRDRDPHREGLAYIRHPWESGLDNAPMWDSLLGRIPIDSGVLPPYERKDLKQGVPGAERPSDDDYDRYVYLVDLFRRLSYDEQAIREECPFLIQGPQFNAILCKANEDLIEIADLLGEDSGRLREWMSQTQRALRSKLWNERRGAFDVFDLRAGRHLGARTAAGFMPLYCGAPSASQARRMYALIESKSFCPMHDGSCFSVPNYDLTGDFLDPKNYWRGPVWINTNWLMAEGLKRYGFEKKAESVRYDMIELVRSWGFHEYFDPFEGTGYGTDNFSWSAALFIDAALGSGS